MFRALPVVVVLSALLLPAAAARADSETLGVLGQAEVVATPDIGTFSADVVRTSPTSVGARARTNGRLRAIVAALTGLGVPRASITTTTLSLSRDRTRTKRGALRVRYTATGAFGVRVQGLDVLGKALEAVAAAGATSVDGPEYDFSPAVSTQARLAAEQQALTDARSRADAAAASQGQHVVGVQSIELDPSSDASGTALAPTAAAVPSTAKTTAPAPVLPGTQTFSSTVRVVYVMAPNG